MRVRLGALLVVLLAVSRCASTADAEKAEGSKYIGQDSDAFFSRYGPPRSYFELNNGGKVYTWVGGEGSIHIPEETQVIPIAPGAQKTTAKTTTTQKTTGNTTVTKSTTTGVSVGTPAIGIPVVTKAAQDIPLYCELQITTDADGDITDIRATGDTQSGYSFGSRCAQVFGVKK